MDARSFSFDDCDIPATDPFYTSPPEPPEPPATQSIHRSTITPATAETIKQALFRYLDKQPERQISAWQLHDAMYLLTGRKTMPATLLQYAREYADISGAIFRCFDSRTSTYSYKPGAKISGAIMGGKE